MKRILPRLAVLAAALIVTAFTAAAQVAPSGSCVVEIDGESRWCWPIRPAEPGSICYCPTPDGQVQGIGQ